MAVFWGGGVRESAGFNGVTLRRLAIGLHFVGVVSGFAGVNACAIILTFISSLTKTSCLSEAVGMRSIPMFNSEGLLPPGDYEVSFADLRRSILVSGLGIGSGIVDQHGNEFEFPAAFRQSRRGGKPRGIVKEAAHDSK